MIILKEFYQFITNFKLYLFDLPSKFTYEKFILFLEYLRTVADNYLRKSLITD